MRRWHALSLALAAALLLHIACSHGLHGLSNDEEVQHVYGRLLLDFYASGFEDRAAFAYRNLYLYGGFFDLIAAGLERLGWAGTSVWDLRHLLSAGFGFVGIVYAALLARRIGGPRAGFLAALLLSLTGAWSGAMFTHTKDVPFGAAMAAGLYHGSAWLAALPAPPWRHRIGLGLALGAALGLRVGGVFLGFYLAAGLLALAWAAEGGPRARWIVLGRGLLAGLPSLALGLALMALAWPWSVMGPDHVLQAARAFSHFAFDLWTVLDGQAYRIAEVPRSYLLHYLAVRLPEGLLLGLLAALLLGGAAGLRALRAGPAGRRRLALVLPLILAASFPLFFTLLTAPPLYNGLRHFTFVLPPLAVCAGLGLDALGRRMAPAPKLLRAGFGLALLLLLLDPAWQLLRLHPYQSVAYNHLIGPLAGAERRWEMDYWGDSLREAATALNARLAAEGPPPAQPYKAAVCAELIQGEAVLDRRDFVVTRDWLSADFFLSPTQTGCDAALQGEVIERVQRLGATLAVVKDRRGLPPSARAPRPPPP